MENEFPRRVVVWAENPAETALAAHWAAEHAAARSLPLHVMHVAGTGTLAEAGRPGLGGAVFAAHEETALDVARLARGLRRVRDLHPDLPVTVSVVEDGEWSARRPHTEPGDLLVTGSAGFLRLAERGEGGADPRPGPVPVRVPVVIVPGTPQSEPRGARRRMLLVTGSRLSPDAAAFAFRAAAELSARLDVVRVAAQGGTFGDDYWIDPGRAAYRGETRLQNELAKLRARFPTVPGSAATLRTRPWATLRTMARSVHLAVLGVGPETGSELSALLDLGHCPVALIPEA